MRSPLEVGWHRRSPRHPLFESPRTALLLMGLKMKWDNLLTAEWEDGIWVKVHGCFVVVVLPN